MKSIRKITQKDLKRKALTRVKSTYLKTPHETVSLGEDGNPEYDSEGNPIFIPVIHEVPQGIAIERIKKGAGSVEVDPETGEISHTRAYSIATDEDIKQYEEQRRRYRNRRARAIKARGVKQARHFVQVSSKEVNPELEEAPEEEDKKENKKENKKNRK
jgi:hypothetical protein